MRTVVLGAVAACAVRTGAGAVTLDFNDLAVGGYGTSVTVDGHTFSSVDGVSMVAGNPTGLGSEGNYLTTAGSSGLHLARADGDDWYALGFTISMQPLGEVSATHLPQVSVNHGRLNTS